MTDQPGNALQILEPSLAQARLWLSFPYPVTGYPIIPVESTRPVSSSSHRLSPTHLTRQIVTSYLELVVRSQYELYGSKSRSRGHQTLSLRVRCERLLDPMEAERIANIKS